MQPEETIAERVKLRRQKADDEYLSDMPPLEGNEGLADMLTLEEDEEEVKAGKGIKISTPNKLLTRISILLAQTKEQEAIYPN